MTLEDHVKFGEVLTFFNDLLVSQEDMAVEVAHEVADKFVTGFNTFISEHVFEILYERLEKIMR